MINSVCIFGDSLSKGIIFDSVMKKYILLKDCFANMIKTSSNIIVKNYSKFGSTISKGLETLYQHKDELINFDYIALEFGGNDCNFDWGEISTYPGKEHLPHTPLDLFMLKYIEMINEVKKCGSFPVLLTLPPIVSQKYFSWISRELNAENILHWLGDVEQISRWHQKYNLAIYQLAKNCCTPLIDINREFLKITNLQNLFCEDGIHPNKEGHKLISSIIDNSISQYRAAFSS